MDPVCRIEVDLGESRAVVAALVDEDVEVIRTRLRIGDYALPGGAIVERKAVRDLHLSVRIGRFWRQIGALKTATRPVLLIEGISLDLPMLPPRTVRGICLAVAEQGIEVIRSVDARDTACWLTLLARRPIRRRRDRPVYAQTRKVAPVAAGELLLASIPGISVGQGRALLDRFGSVAGIAAADEDELLAVPGVGQMRAAAIRRALLS